SENAEPSAFHLVSRESEVTFCRALCPGARNFSVCGTNIIEPSFGVNVNRFPGLVFPISFDTHRPVCYVQNDTAQRRGIGRRIEERSSNVFSIPIHYERHMITLGRAGSPISGPRTG